jgi:hypothetical protein
VAGDLEALNIGEVVRAAPPEVLAADPEGPR